jgi:hypothetical protein
MYNSPRTAALIQALTSIWSPEYLGWFMKNRDSWRPINLDWKRYYLTERDALAKLVLKEFNTHLNARGSVTTKDFKGYENDLAIFKEAMLNEIENYHYNVIDTKKFFNYVRLRRCIQNFEDRMFGDILKLTSNIYSHRVSKEELIAIINTFCYCFAEIAENIGKKDVDIAALERLELPVNTEELKALVESCSSFGELFPWSKSDQGFKYWAERFLNKKKNFCLYVYEYLEDLNPNLKLARPMNYTTVDSTLDRILATKNYIEKGIDPFRIATRP